MIEEVMRLLQEFFDEERGNRVTSNNMSTLMLKVRDTMTRNMQEDSNVKEDNGTSR